MGIEYVASFIGSVWKKLAGWVAAQARRIITTASATFIGAYLVYLFAPPWKGVADWFMAVVCCRSGAWAKAPVV